MKPTCAVIPAAGKGTRLYPLTYAVPKELLPLGPCPTIQHVVADITAAGVNDIVIVTAQGKDAIREHFDALGERGEIDATFTYVIQKEQRGLGHAVHTAEAAVGGRAFLVALGDDVIAGSQPGGFLRRMQTIFEQNEADAVVAVHQIEPADTVKYGIVAPGEASGDGIRLLDLVEKPQPENAPSNLAICGRYLLNPVIFEYLAKQAPGVGGEIQITDALSNLASCGGGVYACPLRDDEKRLDVGDLQTYYQAVVELAGPILGGGAGA